MVHGATVTGGQAKGQAKLCDLGAALASAKARVGGYT